MTHLPALEPQMPAITISALNIYPVKSCRGISLQRAELTVTGLARDREWMIVTREGRFVTQREQPRLALIHTALDAAHLTLTAPAMPPLQIPLTGSGPALMVSVWGDRCPAFDQGLAAQHWLSGFLDGDYSLVRFDPTHKRASSVEWTGGVEALNQFSDGYPLLLISQASLEDLSARVGRQLPTNRFRPNIVVTGLPPYGEDQVDDLISGGTRLRVVKPCTRCKITTTNQDTGEVEGVEPLHTLKSYRLSRELRGVTFGQNVIVIAGTGSALQCGQTFEHSAKSAG
jgi:uncharacterized protein